MREKICVVRRGIARKTGISLGVRMGEDDKGDVENLDD